METQRYSSTFWVWSPHLTLVYTHTHANTHMHLHTRSVLHLNIHSHRKKNSDVHLYKHIHMFTHYSRKVATLGDIISIYFCSSTSSFLFCSIRYGLRLPGFGGFFVAVGYVTKRWCLLNITGAEVVAASEKQLTHNCPPGISFVKGKHLHLDCDQAVGWEPLENNNNRAKETTHHLGVLFQELGF